MERNVIFALFVCPFFAYVRSKARTAMRGAPAGAGGWHLEGRKGIDLA